MSASADPRRILHMPGSEHMTAAERQAHVLRLARKNEKRFIRSLYEIVNISAEVEPDEPLPAAFRAAGEAMAPSYWLSESTNQPIVWNGFVWSYRADGSHNRVQHFVEGADIHGGRPIRIFNGQLNMHAADGTVVVCRYVLGICISCTTRPAFKGKGAFAHF